MKLFAQLGLIGAKIAGKVVADTYRQMAASTWHVAVSWLTLSLLDISKNVAQGPKTSSRMELDEALKILNVTMDTPREELAQVPLFRQPVTLMSPCSQRYNKLFEMNDRLKGGSFYLQSKVVRARERLEIEYEQSSKKHA